MGSAAVMRVGEVTRPSFSPTIFVVDMPTSIPMMIPMIIYDLRFSIFDLFVDSQYGGNLVAGLGQLDLQSLGGLAGFQFAVA